MVPKAYDLNTPRVLSLFGLDPLPLELRPWLGEAKPLGFGLGGEAGEGLGQREGLLFRKARAPGQHHGSQGQKRRTVNGV